MKSSNSPATRVKLNRLNRTVTTLFVSGVVLALGILGLADALDSIALAFVSFGVGAACVALALWMAGKAGRMENEISSALMNYRY